MHLVFSAEPLKRRTLSDEDVLLEQDDEERGLIELIFEQNCSYFNEKLVDFDEFCDKKEAIYNGELV